MDVGYWIHKIFTCLYHLSIHKIKMSDSDDESVEYEPELFLIGSYRLVYLYLDKLRL